MDFSWVKAFGKGIWALLLSALSLAAVGLVNYFFDNSASVVSGTVPFWAAPIFLFALETLRNYIKQHLPE